MRKIVLYVFMLLPMLLWADQLSDILNKKYDAATLTAAAQDSLLNGQSVLTDEEILLPQNRYSIEYENKQKMFRHSFWADWYVKDNKKGERFAMTDTMVRDAAMSPNGQYVVYGKGQNLYIYKTLYKTEIPVTTESSQVFCGLSDWLYEEEFGITRLFEFSPESKLLAYVRLDEQQVPTFSWQTFRGLSYPATHFLRYPKAGTANATASVCVYDVSNKGIRTIQLPAMEDAYIPRLKWRNENELLIERINRDQTQIEVFVANPKSTVATLLYKEKSDVCGIDYATFDAWQWLSDGRFVLMSEKSGWRRLYLYSAQGIEQQLLTPDEMDVTEVYGVDEKTGWMYYQAAPDAAERQVYAVNIKSGKITRLTQDAGIHVMTFSKDLHRALGCYQNIKTAGQYTLYTVDGNKLKPEKSAAVEVINQDNQAIEEAWRLSGLTDKQFIRIPTERGDTLDAWVILPPTVRWESTSSTTKYPVVMMQYSGPCSQRVLNQWRHRFGHYLASQGYVVVNADPRGTDNRGRAWRSQTYMQLGKKEAEDHLSVARYMQTLPFVDAQRIAMIGWSYGGFQTIRTMCEQPTPLIRCGIAIAPVTDWTLYDTGYTERYMRRPQVNEQGYQAADLCAMASRLQGQLLLVHATGDDNVHYQNTLLLSDALVRAGKQFDTQLYIDDNHSLLDQANNEHLHRKILIYLQKNL